MICTSAAELNVTAHAIWQRKIRAFGFAAVVVPHSAMPQSTENILMETINPGKNIVAGKNSCRAVHGAAAVQRGLFSSLS